MNRLLILACSQRRNPAKGKLPAIQRYDGPAFRVLRKYLREHPGDSLTVLILSAKHGLIPADRKIADYDCRISEQSAQRLRPQIHKVAMRVLSSGDWRGIGVCVGKKYRLALAGFAQLVPQAVRVAPIQGGQGVRLSALRAWLWQSDSGFD